ncbi:hypothetical protein G7Z17_g212 [Cylindrodendrum hubeiense]|uniref:Fucose-specific lectin n=1 Tax=Cylindrodendrum hubeiense TaxID=595255 RepID=A0A9P5HN48_9HYPO|nr:hypothetical protein G7Z17_g212 [Cylindrodendrum hubeiense]
MASPIIGDDHSTLEVNVIVRPLYLEDQKNSLPEVDRTATEHFDYPEVDRAATEDLDYPEVNRAATAHLDFPELHHKEKGYDEQPAPTISEATSAPWVCGRRQRLFIGGIVAAIIVIMGLAVGLTLGLKTTGGDNTNTTPKDSPGDASNDISGLLANTKLAAANFTDEFGFENFLVFYQLKSRAIYMSAHNSSHGQWLASPVVDGTNGTSLDGIREGTHLGLDVYYHDVTADDGIEAGYLTGTGEEALRNLDLSDAYPPSTNTSIAVASVAAVNGTRGLNVFYSMDSGVLTQLRYHEDGKYEQKLLPMGLKDDSSIVAFSTGFNETDDDNDEPLALQVLATDPTSENGVFLIYFYNGEWASGDKVTELSNCSSWSSMAATFSGRVYCVVNGDGEDVEIAEWSWNGDAKKGPETFTDYEKVGTLSKEQQREVDEHNGEFTAKHDRGPEAPNGKVDRQLPSDEHR